MAVFPEYRLCRRGSVYSLLHVENHALGVARVANSEELQPWLRQRTQDLAQEVIGAFFLDKDGWVLAGSRMSVGCESAVICDPASFVRLASMIPGCRRIIKTHNHVIHPAIPSAVDLESMRRLQDRLEANGLELWDFLLVSAWHDPPFYSAREAGDLLKQAA